MVNYKNKVDWCLKKANKGLKKINPDIKNAKKHLKVAAYNIETADYLKKGNFTKWVAPTLFYSVYHSFLAILMKEGYLTENQDCTFALIATMIKEGKLTLEINKLETIMSYNPEEGLRGFREKYQYGIEMTAKNSLIKEMEELAKEILEIVTEESIKW